MLSPDFGVNMKKKAMCQFRREKPTVLFPLGVRGTFTERDERALNRQKSE